jgi:adenylate cyclase class IV
MLRTKNTKTGSAEKKLSKTFDNDREYEYAFRFPEKEWRGEGVEKLRKKLLEVGAKKRLEVVMPLAAYHHPNYKPDDQAGPYVRVRHEGPHVAFTVKTDRTAQFVKEYEVKVSPTDTAVGEMHKLLSALEFPLKYRVEKLREIWDMEVDGKDVEIVMDTYPGLPTYFEVETHNKEVLDKATKILGFDPKDDFSADRDNYSYVYGFSKDRVVPPGSELTFSPNAKKQFKGKFKKNEKLFDELLKKQIEYVDSMK